MTLRLTADLCAQAVVAAARALGEDPVLALTGPKIKGAGSIRRCLCPAVLAIVEATGAYRHRVCAILGADKFAVAKAARQWPEAVEAARRAISADAAEPVAAEPVGTVVAPPPVALEAPAPARVDHTAAIAEALARRRARTAGIDVVVVGVEADRALIGATEPGGCVWPMGDPGTPDYRSCQAKPLTGRLYCAKHLKKAGMKPVAKPLATVGRVAAPYADREAG